MNDIDISQETTYRDYIVLLYGRTEMIHYSSIKHKEESWNREKS